MQTALDVTTAPDGTLVITPHGDVGAEEAVELRQVLVHAVRRTRPLRLDVDLADVGVIDSINIGTLAAVCALADVHHVAVFYTRPSGPLASRLAAAGVPSHRIRW